MEAYKRFARHNQVLTTMDSVLERADPDDISYPFLQMGTIAKFRVQFNLALQLFREQLGREEGRKSAKTVLETACSAYPFLETELWMPMLDAWKRILHLDEEDQNGLDCLLEQVRRQYVPAFFKLQEDLEAFSGDILFK